MLYQIENLISVLVGFLGFILVTIICTSYKSNKLVNIYLVIVFVLVSVRHLHNGLSGFFMLDAFNNQLPYFKSIFLIGVPSFYLYFKSLFEDITKSNNAHFKHFIFPVIQASINSLQNALEYLNFKIVELIQIASILIFLIIYSVKVIQLIHKNLISNKYKSFSNNNEHHVLIKKWILFFSTVAIILSIRAIYSICYETSQSNPIIAYTFSYISSIIWLITFIYILLNPEILFGYPKLKEKLNELELKNTTLSNIWDDKKIKTSNQQDAKLQNTLNVNAKKYIIQIEKHINNNNPFRNTKYSMKELSAELNIPASHIAYIFKYHCKMPFVEYKNYMRVNDASKLIEDNFLENKTLEALSEKTGFITYNSFFIAFKKYKGVSPKEFLTKT